ncbi:MAG: hypothetical protein WC857_02905 [Candidatus Paceibacterota bacterium]|jgi:hypothetical protein
MKNLSDWIFVLVIVLVLWFIVQAVISPSEPSQGSPSDGCVPDEIYAP